MAGERDYSQMSSQELNDQLKRIFQIFPTSIAEMVVFDGIDGAKMMEVEENRKKSQVKDILIKNLQDILKYAQITQSFRIYLEQSLEGAYVTGQPKDPDDQTLTGGLVWLLDYSQPNSGGIFDKSRAKYLEAAGYAEYVDIVVGVRELEEKFKDKLNPETVSQHVEKDKSIVALWEEEYQNFYADIQ